MMADKSSILDTLAREELGIDPEELGGSAYEAAFTSFFLFAFGALFPILPYLFWSGTTAIIPESDRQRDRVVHHRRGDHADDGSKRLVLRYTTGAGGHCCRGVDIRDWKIDRSFCRLEDSKNVNRMIAI